VLSLKPQERHLFRLIWRLNMNRFVQMRHFRVACILDRRANRMPVRQPD